FPPSQASFGRPEIMAAFPPGGGTHPRPGLAPDCTDARPVSERNWAIDISDADLAKLIRKKLGKEGYCPPGLQRTLMTVIIATLRPSDIKDPSHPASDVFQEAIISLLKRRAGCRPVPSDRLLPYLLAVCRRAAWRVVQQARCVSRLKDRDGNIRYVQH